MFCSNCGKKIPDDVQFCEFCGAKNDLAKVPSESKAKKVTKETVAEKPQETVPVQPSTPATPPEPKKPMSKNAKIGLFAGIGGGVVAIIALVIFLIIPKSINMNKYIKFAIDLSESSYNYNGYGRAVASIDWDAFDEECGRKVSFTQAVNTAQYEKASEVVSQFISIDQEVFNNLSNGDEVTVTISVSEKAPEFIKNKFDKLTATYPISGLSELNRIDLLSVINDPRVSFTGPNGKTTASVNYQTGDEATHNEGDLIIAVDENSYSKSINVLQNNQLLASVRYVIAEEGPFSNGDEITLKLENVEKLIELGYGPKDDNIKITVENRPEIITDVNGISDESIKGFVNWYVHKLNKDHGYEPYSEHCYRNESSGSAFAMVAKPSTVTDHPYGLLIDINYEYAYPGYKRTNTTNYSQYVVLYDVYLDNNQLFCGDYESGSYYSWGYSNIWDYIDKNSSEYDFTQKY